MSADPFVQFPESGQSLNRYSYVMNNPLSLTDPSGFFIRELAQVAIQVGLAIATSGTSLTLTHSIALGFASGFILSGGDLKAALIGGLSAGAFHGIGSYFKGLAQEASLAYGPGIGLSSGLRALKVLAHGVVGGVSSALMGGKFVAGFLAAGVTQAASGSRLFVEGQGINLRNTFVAAIVGGTASVIGGGRFANGAVTGAFAYAIGSVGQGSRNSSRNELTGMAPEEEWASIRGSPRVAVAETPWDIVNVGYGVAEFSYDVATGNYVGAAVTGVATVYDVAVTLVPGLPGGANTLLKGYQG